MMRPLILTGSRIVPKSVLLLALVVALAGCSKEEETPWMRLQAAAPQVKVVADTPEAAVKSWWEARDQHEKYSLSICKELTELYRPIRSAQDSLATDDLLAKQANQNGCPETSYTRHILNVDVQSDTRALVVAQIQNTTPPTPGYVPDSDERAKKERGDRMQYLLERADKTKSWKIAQVYTSDRYCTVAPVGGWCPVYSNKKGSANTYVFEFDQ